jgi:hypothetical protein
MKDSTLLKVTAIVAVTVIEVVNLFTAKIDSVLTSTIVAVIAGLAGYSFGKTKKKG